MRTTEWMSVASAVLLRVLIVCIIVTAVPHGPLEAARRYAPQKDVTAQPREEEKTKGVPVILEDREVLLIYSGIKGYTPEERAKEIGKRLHRYAEDYTLDPGAIIIEESDISSDILFGDKHVLAVTDGDARAVGRARPDLALEYAQKIRSAVDNYRKSYSRESILYGALYTVIAALVLFAAIVVIRKLFRKIDSVIETRYKARIGSIHIKSLELVQAERLAELLVSAVRLIRITLIVLAVYVFLNTVLSFFPWTRPISAKLLGYVLIPLKVIGNGILAHIPNVIFLAVLIVITRYVFKLMQIFFSGVEKGTITIAGFYPEWAQQTYRLARFVVLAFVAVIAFPYIPGSDTPAFKGISIFVGILFSLGSQSAIANVIAGVALTYRRVFKIGDRVKIGDIVGDVTEMKMAVTRLRTVKNEEVAVPNGVILNSAVINYSTLAKEKGLILHTSVTIGYDTPWRQVHGLLLLAADRTPGLLRQPEPFVLQTSLDDFFVSYELNVYTDKTEGMNRLYSALHKNIQDAFNEYGVQIMSPHYEADRSKATFVPKEHWFDAPAERLEKEGVKPENEGRKDSPDA